MWKAFELCAPIHPWAVRAAQPIHLHRCTLYCTINFLMEMLINQSLNLSGKYHKNQRKNREKQKNTILGGKYKLTENLVDSHNAHNEFLCLISLNLSIDEVPEVKDSLVVLLPWLLCAQLQPTWNMLMLLLLCTWIHSRQWVTGT